MSHLKRQEITPFNELTRYRVTVVGYGAISGDKEFKEEFCRADGFDIEEGRLTFYRLVYLGSFAHRNDPIKVFAPGFWLTVEEVTDAV